MRVPRGPPHLTFLGAATLGSEVPEWTHWDNTGAEVVVQGSHRHALGTEKRWIVFAFRIQLRGPNFQHCLPRRHAPQSHPRRGCGGPEDALGPQLPALRILGTREVPGRSSPAGLRKGARCLGGTRVCDGGEREAASSRPTESPSCRAAGPGGDLECGGWAP